MRPVLGENAVSTEVLKSSSRIIGDVEDRVSSVIQAETTLSPHLNSNGAATEQESSKGSDIGAASDQNSALEATAERESYYAESREQRANHILIDNKNDSVWPELRTSSNSLIKNGDEIIMKDVEENGLHSKLSNYLAGTATFIAEKQERLKKEYMELHEKWLANCSRLDCILKSGVSEELVIVTGRATRRSVVTSDAVRSDLEMERIIASLGNEDLTDPNQLAVRNVATIPDMISVINGVVEVTVDNTSVRVNNPEEFYDSRSGFIDWTEEEERIFYEKYSEYPKQFATIASFLAHKTTAQCVLYYYIYKKRLVDFRKAANMGVNKKRRGGRPGKQKSNALLADIQSRDEEKPRRGRRKGTTLISGDSPSEGAKGPGKRSASIAAAAAILDSAEATAEEEGESKSKRRKSIHWAKLLASEQDAEDNASAVSTKDIGRTPPRLTFIIIFIGY